jgi:transcriptional regulator with XRE-family HTH domain
MTDTIITQRDKVKHHRKKLASDQFVLQNWGMADDSKNPYFEQGRRLRWLRQAEGFKTGTAFARKLRWPQSGFSQFENGKRPVTRDKVMQLSREIPGFNAYWLWENDKRGLSFDMRQRIEAEEAKENDTLAGGERQNVR